MRRALAVLVAASIVAVLALVVASTRRPPAASNEPTRPSDTGSTYGHPEATRHASRRTEKGARAAAIEYATASQDWLYLPDEDIDREVRAIATPEAEPTLRNDTVASLRTAREELSNSPGPVWWLVRPLASKVERFDGQAARVVVWVVMILSAPDVALPQADWIRVAVDLRWVDGGWRVDAISDTPGPTPMVGTQDQPWQAQPFGDALDGFERAGSELGP